jgi:hypothetical protein
MALRFFQRLMAMAANVMAMMIALMMRSECAVGVESLSNGRMWWVFPRQQAEWDIIQGHIWRSSPALLDQQWRKQYRMSFRTFLDLVGELRPYVEHANTTFREAIVVEKAVAFVLFRLAHGVSLKIVGSLYGVGESTVIKYTKAVVEALSNRNQLLGRHIIMPTGATLTKIIADFKATTGLDNMCGAIDGSHIKIHRKPRAALVPDEYWCRHDFHSVLLQAICDDQKVFWDVCCRLPGGSHDATHLRASTIWLKLREREVLQGPVVRVGNKDIRPYIVGDSAYPLQAQILKPFNARAVGNQAQNLFDKQMRKGRVKIENAFGILKNRWQILKNCRAEVEWVGRIAIACCVLHNICQRAGEPGDQAHIQDEHPNNVPGPDNDFQVFETEAQSKAIGRDVRNALLADFAGRMLQHE